MYNHDLSLPDWGPYTKKYAGISHVADKKRGLRFDLSVFPGLYRRKVDVPSVLWESGYHPWHTSPDFSYFSNRHELDFGGLVYADISFSEMSANCRLIRAECVNQSGSHEDMVIHFMANMNYPSGFSTEASLPEKSLWKNAVDYSDMQYKTPKFNDNLMPHGKRKGEIRDDAFVGGFALGDKFGGEAGDYAKYIFALPCDFENAVLIIRYRNPANENAEFLSSGIYAGNISLPFSNALTAFAFDIGKISRGETYLKICSLGNSKAEINGFVICEKADMPCVSFENKAPEFVPEIIKGKNGQSVILKYKDAADYYGIAWKYSLCEIRQFFNGELDRELRMKVHNHVNQSFGGDGKGHFTNAFLRPVSIPPMSEKIIYGLACSGDFGEVSEYISSFEKNDNVERIYLSKKRDVFDGVTENGEKYIFSEERMAATTLANVVYPTMAEGQFIKHNTPGRWWDCLYTWDSGFIGMGLLELDEKRAVECLNAYLTSPESEQAFIQNGSTVPTQVYLFSEILNRTNSMEFLREFYPKIKKIYDFYSGKYTASTVKTLASGMTKLWDYCYNSGGFDDYPPQVYVHKEKLEKSVAPVINISQTIMTAKILKTAAELLCKPDDIAVYENDIKTFSDTVQKYAWDENSGYFGYVVHDENGNANGILRHPDGSNYNKGIDGVYPMIAGICTKAQQERLLSHLFTEGEMWTEIGISAVDTSASYYKTDGYWNGAVWMPHQWFVWKALLDMGMGEMAFRIAKTALDLWKTETDISHNCFEHFIIQSGRGAGWHQFGALSTPVLIWFSAYYRNGRISCGFNTFILEKKFSGDNSFLAAKIKIGKESNAYSSVIVTLSGENHTAYWQGKKIPLKKYEEGFYEVLLPGNSQGILEIGG